ncbi:MAG: thiamine pyrophosphate-dependent dehydrogenase E1 component subunit alpha [Rubrivivax sp.]|nr:thiamine pyrophosphate-dependent dehydrogenase E1 component subunit alpha [Rubrivivax sp.]
MSASDRLLDLYRLMCRIRCFEEAAEAASMGGVAAWGLAASDKPALVRGPLHLSIGQEAVAAGVCLNLQREDLLTSTHRGHGHTLAKGASAERMMCELFGRATGYNRGKGGSMHIADFSVGMLGANGVVAAGIPIATGAAHALKVRRLPHVVACFFGDGAANRGPFLEGLNWAKVYQLPVLFVCEDNRISATTPTGPMTAGAGVSARAESMSIPALKVDGNDAEAVDAAAAKLLAEVRAGQGPRLLHAVTYRFKGHVSVDPGSYRDPAEVKAALERDPVRLARERLLATGADPKRIEQVWLDAKAEIDAALEVAAAAPWPETAAAYEDIMNTGAGVWR